MAKAIRAVGGFDGWLAWLIFVVTDPKTAWAVAGCGAGLVALLGARAWSTSPPIPVVAVLAAPEDVRRMARYQMSDGLVVETSKAAHSWDEATRTVNGKTVSVATGTEFSHQRLHRSKRGRFYLERWSDWKDAPTAGCEWLSDEEAIRWLLLNFRTVPTDLTELADKLLD